ncbi:hypothetical protein M23134_01024 [Microscilla marina ATCC 23134]|uniref:Uncharacterized protein n=1 Tax=Microscilla marina ATCC 23134 TaxID=313606 RepID=A1ZFC6_MICM2|nr:hypothetical protein M23134_01024 [Microscilla marina ATCC 23134]
MFFNWRLKIFSLKKQAWAYTQTSFEEFRNFQTISHYLN